MEQRCYRISVGIPTKGQTESTAYDSHLGFFEHLGKLEAFSQLGHHEEGFVYPEGVSFKFRQVIIPRIFPALAREKLAQYALEDGCDYLLMYDDDMILPQDMFERLFNHDVDVVAPLAFTRLAPFRPVIYNLTKGYDAVERKDYYINLEVPNYPKDQLTQVDAVGFGAVLIKTELFKKMKKPWMMTTSGAGEDIHFCHSAGTAGFKVFVDTATKLGHVGEPLVVTEAIYEAQQQQRPDDVYGKEKKYA